MNRQPVASFEFFTIQPIRDDHVIDEHGFFGCPISLVESERLIMFKKSILLLTFVMIFLFSGYEIVQATTKIEQTNRKTIEKVSRKCKKENHRVNAIEKVKKEKEMELENTIESVEENTSNTMDTQDTSESVASASLPNAPQASLSAIDSLVIDNMNALRNDGLSNDGNLNYFASIRAQEVSYCWSHTRPNGGRGIDLIDASKYRGENLAKTVIYNYTGSIEDISMVAQRIVDNWANSSSHYSNMINANYRYVGVSTYVVVEGNKSTFYTAAMFSN